MCRSKHTIKRVFLEKVTLLNVSVNHFFRLMPGLPHNGECIKVVLGSRGGKAVSRGSRFRLKPLKSGPSFMFAASIQSCTAITAQV